MTCHEGTGREESYSSTPALDVGGCLTLRPGQFTSGNDPVPVVQQARWEPGPVRTGAENFASARDNAGITFLIEELIT
jgi:hypothetical protein